MPIFVVLFLGLVARVAFLAMIFVNQVSAAASLAISSVQAQPEVLVVGSEQNYPPFAIGMTDATADGFTVDLWKAVAAETGLHFTIRVRPFHEILQEFKDGKVDVLINLAQSEERHQFADFTVPHVTIHGAIFVRKGDTQIHAENDLLGKSIIVLNADLAHDYAVAKGWEKQLVLVDTTEQGLRLLASGKHDAMLLSKLAGLKTLRDLNITNVEALDVKAGFTQKFSFAVHKEKAELLAKINEGLALTKPSGTFERLYEKWFAPYEQKQVTFWDVFPYLAPIALILLGFSAYEFFKRQLEHKRTAALLALSARVFKEAHEAIMITDAHGIIIDVNPAFSEITGYSRDEVIGQSPHVFNVEIHGSEFFAAMWADLDKQGYWQSERWNRKKNGERYCEHITISTLRDVGGKVIHYVGFFSDISERKRIEIELADKEGHLSTLIATTPVGVFETDQDGKCTFVNERWSEITGLSFEAARADGWMHALHPDDQEKVLAEWAAAVSEKRPFHLEYRFQRSDGNITYVIGETRESCSVTGELLGYIGTITDITERKQNEIELRIAATAFDSQEGIIVTDANNNILRVNSAFTVITGYTAAEVVGKNPRILQSGKHDASFYAAMWESINTSGTWQGEVWNRRKSGEVFPEHLIITAVKDQNGSISNYVATLTDITLRKEAINKIEQLAFYDPLTGLPNRRLLQERLKQALLASQRSGRQGALLFIDMDNFKTLNDTFGHDMGDLLLQMVAQRLESCVRACDTVARLGGDEFVVMLEDLSEQTHDAVSQTEIVANKIMAITNQSFQLDTREYHCTPSIGITLFKGQQQTSEELLKQADIAMYQAKTSGRNTLRFFNPKMQ